MIQLEPQPLQEDLQKLLSLMAERQRHRGDEEVEFWQDAALGVALGRIRRPGPDALPWPVVVTENRDVLFLDGFLHTHGLSPEQDGERFFQRISQRDAAVLAELRGSFALLAGSLRPSRRIVLATDHRASRQLFYAVAAGALWFAPEVKALLVVPGLPRQLDAGAAAVLLASGFVLQQQTLLQAVRRLSGGQQLLITEGSWRVQSYWDYQLSVTGDGTSLPELEAELAHEVRKAVQRAFSDPRQDLIFLSGGIDSRAILAAACELDSISPQQLQTVSWCAATSGAPSADSDLGVAAQIVSALGLQHRRLERCLDRYGERVLELTYLLDGLSDVPAFHPYEAELMRQLADAGIRRVLRGDECFGWRRRMRSAAEALLEVELRPLGGIRGWEQRLRPDAYRDFCAASAAELSATLLDCSDAHPDNVKDLAYFRHRLQSYLQSAAYFKEVFLDHRAPLVDRELLDLNGRLPVAERRDKALYGRAMARAFPELWRIPIAQRNNLEDYAALLARESPVRQAVAVELADLGSGFWQLFDRDVWIQELAAHRVTAAPGSRHSINRRVRAALQTLVRQVPPLEHRLRTAYRQRTIRPDDLFLRFLVLKQAYDLFIVGDGSQQALAKQRARYQEGACVF